MLELFKCKISTYLLLYFCRREATCYGKIAHKDVGKRLLVMTVQKLSMMLIGRICKNVNNA